ncbi:unnamed protein product [Cladocopium goreaui]|uniref:Tubby-related protein 3 n=1 Tax=Cladocopium goreaui TaxID=2562237 RepID=A0A9P1GA89_9DINO|nr:unnamed protein product [Cladocopium goreaui]
MASNGDLGSLRFAASGGDDSSPQVCDETQGYPAFEVRPDGYAHHGYPRMQDIEDRFGNSPLDRHRANSWASWHLTDVEESLAIEPDGSPSSPSASPLREVDTEDPTDTADPTSLDPAAKRKARKRRNSEFFNRPMLLPALGTMMARHHFASQVPRGTLQGRLQVLRAGGLGLKRPRYGLYVIPPHSEEVLLMAAERQSQLKLGPYYVISSNALDFDRDSPCFLGRLSGNATCTQYLLHGQRIGGSGTSGTSATLREELAALRFRKPTDAPRRMQVVLPNGTTSYSSRSGQEGQLLAAAEGTMPRQQFGYMVNTSPTWDAARKVYRMNFHNRVMRASSKNFQLIKADSSFKAETPEFLAMQFGRVDETSFSFDASGPLSPLQAFAIALSVFDDRVYEALRIYY